MTLSFVADTENLPGGWAIDQIWALREFNAAIIISPTTHVELVAKDARGMMTFSSAETTLARAPFIPVYAVDLHCVKNNNLKTMNTASSSEKQVATLRFCSC